MNYYAVIIILGTLVFPWTALASVVINEIAWMGTSASANAEWIELYNESSESVDLTGWKLIAKDGSPAITLKGTIQSEGYFLLERSSDNTVPDVSADQIYTGALGNDGEYLELKNTEGQIIDQIDATDGWPAGNNTTKETMQRTFSGGWITAPGTPRSENQQQGTDDDSGDDNSGGGSPNPPPKKPTETKKEEIIPIKPDPTYSATMKFPDNATRGMPVPFSVIVRENGKRDMVSGKFDWSMGDGARYVFSKNTDFEHTFQYAGDYTVVMTYYSSVLKKEPDSVHKKKISIGEYDVTISDITDDYGIVLQNNTDRDIDLHGWSIYNEHQWFVFPQYTVVPKKKTLTISPLVTGMYGVSDILFTLRTPHYKLVNSFKKPSQIFQEPIAQVDLDMYDSEQEDWGNIPALEDHEEISFIDNLWNDYKWYVIVIGAVCFLGLAYLIYDLYATRQDWFDDPDEE